ncbi:MAG TPA: hypothetical protein VFF67_08805 [Thermoplasmata archaeon]|nr:hypothetical protein [Thermoplasmata archaeon]
MKLATPEPEPPEVLQIARRIAPGRHALLDVFEGLDQVPAFRAYPLTPRKRRSLANDSTVEVARRRGEWMYVAPHQRPPNADRRWRPIVTDEDCVVVSGEHLRKSPALTLYLDILHELCHVVQRWEGRELWDEQYEYVDRPTEVEAYVFAVKEARRLGASDGFLREYLRVMWITRKQLERLWTNVGVPPAPKRRRRAP